MLRSKPSLRRAVLRTTLIGSLIGAMFSSMVHAADWSDTSISARYGSSFAEPYDNNADGSRKDIKKAILALTNVTGYKYDRASSSHARDRRSELLRDMACSATALLTAEVRRRHWPMHQIRRSGPSF